jgi:hypothetical protein
MTAFRFLLSRVAAACAAALMATVACGQTVDFGPEGPPPLTQRPTTALVVVSGVRFLAGPVAGSTPLPNRIAFLSLVDVYRENLNGFLLVKAQGTDDFGWISKADVLQSDKCLRVSQDNPVYQKVTLRNDWKAGGSSSNDQRPPLPQEVEFLSAPGRSGSRLTATRISSILHIFSQREADGEVYLLLGADPKWDPHRPGACIKGWVLEKQCTRWNSRIAVYYNQNNKGQRPKVAMFRNKARSKAGRSLHRSPCSLTSCGWTRIAFRC